MKHSYKNACHFAFIVDIIPTTHSINSTATPSSLNLPIIWIADESVRKQKIWHGKEKERGKNEENQRNERMVITCKPGHR